MCVVLDARSVRSTCYSVDFSAGCDVGHAALSLNLCHGGGCRKRAKTDHLLFFSHSGICHYNKKGRVYSLKCAFLSSRLRETKAVALRYLGHKKAFKF
jgi:hypothetical protein